jgi:site-specific DNA recombinase
MPDHITSTIMVVPWRKMPSKRPREIILPARRSSHRDLRPIRAETRARLVMAIAKGRRWLDALMAGTTTNVEQIASTENCTVRQINMTISLAFLAPNLVQAAVDGRLPRGVGIANLRDAPAQWSLQYARLGLAS